MILTINPADAAAEPIKTVMDFFQRKNGLRVNSDTLTIRIPRGDDISWKDVEDDLRGLGWKIVSKVEE